MKGMHATMNASPGSYCDLVITAALDIQGAFGYRIYP